jgi:hypothetical protein
MKDSIFFIKGTFCQYDISMPELDSINFQFQNLYESNDFMNFTVNQSLTENYLVLTEIDDFKLSFESFVIKMMTFIIFLLLMTAVIIFDLTVIHFEKYGGDPMKRSLVNQMSVQGGLHLI